MTRYAFDCETNGLLDTMNTIHSLVLTDVDTGETYSCSDHLDNEGETSVMSIKDGLELLMGADQIIGHNIIGFDIPAIQIVYPRFAPDQDKVFDTLIMSRLIWSDLMDRDAKAVGIYQRTGGEQGLPPKMRGRHSLEAWGLRLGKWKGDYSADMKAAGLDPWANWNQEMQDYCVQDVAVTLAFLELIESKNVDPRAVELEHQIAFIISEQIAHGFMFNKPAAVELLRTLQEERADIESKLGDLFEPWESLDKVVTPKRTMNFKDPNRRNTVAGVSYNKMKMNVFNPGSRAHIADRLMKVRGWKPSEFSSNGQPRSMTKSLVASRIPKPNRSLTTSCCRSA